MYCSCSRQGATCALPAQGHPARIDAYSIADADNRTYGNKRVFQRCWEPMFRRKPVVYRHNASGKLCRKNPRVGIV